MLGAFGIEHRMQSSVLGLAYDQLVGKPLALPVDKNCAAVVDQVITNIPVRFAHLAMGLDGGNIRTHQMDIGVIPQPNLLGLDNDKTEQCLTAVDAFVGLLVSNMRASCPPTQVKHGEAFVPNTDPNFVPDCFILREQYEAMPDKIGPWTMAIQTITYSRAYTGPHAPDSPVINPVIAGRVLLPGAAFQNIVLTTRFG